MPELPPIDVVCGLILHGGKVLAARRDPSRQMPLLWEFPGGKLEDGEHPEQALHRELEEELRLRVRITRALDPVVHDSSPCPIRLIPFICETDQAEAPVPVDHVEIRWIDAAAARQLTWATADIPLVEQLDTLLS